MRIRSRPDRIRVGQKADDEPTFRTTQGPRNARKIKTIVKGLSLQSQPIAGPPDGAGMPTRGSADDHSPTLSNDVSIWEIPGRFL